MVNLRAEWKDFNRKINKREFYLKDKQYLMKSRKLEKNNLLLKQCIFFIKERDFFKMNHWINNRW